VVNLKRVKPEVEGKIYRTSDGISVPRKHDFISEYKSDMEKKKIINAVNQQKL